MRALMIGLSVASSCHGAGPLIRGVLVPGARPITAADRKYGTAPKDSTERREWVVDSTRRDSVVKSLRQVSDGNGRRLFDVEEVDDEQGFPIGSSTPQLFGPPVSGVAQSNLGNLTKVSDFETTNPPGVIVAGLSLAAAAPAGERSYADLNLSAAGQYCVYLRHNPNVSASNQGWEGYIVLSSSTTCSTPTAADEVTVKYVPDPRHGNDGDYPAVVRFGETAGGNGGLPVLIVRCGAAECYMKKGNVVVRPQQNNQDNDLGGDRKAHLRLWQDEQRLALADVNRVLHPGPRAVITPLPNIESYHQNAEFLNQFVPVAWVFMAGDPANTKYGTDAAGKGWGMVKGWNQLRIGFDSSSGFWLAQIQAYGPNQQIPAGLPRTGRVDRAEHDPSVPKGMKPGAARFSWSSSDDGLWVSCDQGCCRVSAFDFQPTS